MSATAKRAVLSFEESRAAFEGRKAEARVLSGSRAVELVGRNGRRSYVHRNTHPEPALPWRLSHFGADLVAWGHSEVHSCEEGVLLALSEGLSVAAVAS